MADDNQLGLINPDLRDRIASITASEDPGPGKLKIQSISNRAQLDDEPFLELLRENPWVTQNEADRVRDLLIGMVDRQDPESGGPPDSGELDETVPADQDPASGGSSSGGSASRDDRRFAGVPQPIDVPDNFEGPLPGPDVGSGGASQPAQATQSDGGGRAVVVVIAVVGAAIWLLSEVLG